LEVFQLQPLKIKALRSSPLVNCRRKVKDLDLNALRDIFKEKADPKRGGYSALRNLTLYKARARRSNDETEYVFIAFYSTQDENVNPTRRKNTGPFLRPAASARFALSAADASPCLTVQGSTFLRNAILFVSCPEV